MEGAVEGALEQAQIWGRIVMAALEEVPTMEQVAWGALLTRRMRVEVALGPAEAEVEVPVIALTIR